MRARAIAASTHSAGRIPWALGVGGVISAAAVLRDGPRDTVKAMMKAGMRGREVAAEASEQLQDLYAEAQAERFPAQEPADR